MTKDEAMKLALEALGNSWTEPGNKQYEIEKEAITALREALAEQPAQQEPAGWRPATFHRDNLTFNPGLPDEQTVKFWKLQGVEIEYCYTTPQPAQQEPVAFLANGTRFKISYDSRQSGGQIHGIPPELGGRWVAFVAAEDDCHLKLTSPPAQRTWVGLTDEQIFSIAKTYTNTHTYNNHTFEEVDFRGLTRAIEAKLKENT